MSETAMPTSVMPKGVEHLPSALTVSTWPACPPL